MQFADLELDSLLIDALKRQGLDKPTTIQQMMIPVALDGVDVLASAPTGTGKTLAFLLPAVQYLLDFPRRDPGFARVLVMTPTRELAYQIYEQALLLTEDSKLRVGVVTGGINYGSHKEIFEQNNDILIATPGRLMEYLTAGSFHAENVELLVLDEADRMLDLGFISEMRTIASEARNRKQAFLLSATLEGVGIEKFAKEVLNEPELIVATPPKSEQGKIHQYIHLADTLGHKQLLLLHILKEETTKRAIIFVKTRERVQQLSAFLNAEQIWHVYLQGEMPQDKRNTAISRLKEGKVNVLVATDVAARGLDIDDVTHVINFDLPRTADVYVHRIGRTARAGKKGTAISLVEAHDMVQLDRIERYTDSKLKRRVIDELRPQHKEARLPVKKKVKEKKKVKKK